MKYVAKLRFDDGSKKGPMVARRGHSCPYEIGEEYKGKNVDQLLKDGLIEALGEKPELNDKELEVEVKKPDEKEDQKVKEKGN